jgi:hypothetical protein
MSEMVRRVATTLAECGGLHPAAATPEGALWPVAIAVIQAMREPTVEMIAAFWRVKNTGSVEPGETGDDRSDYAAYRAMIDAALTR